MAHCKKCGEFFHENNLIDGYCIHCVPKNVLQVAEEKGRKETAKENLAIDSIMITTETYIDIPIEKRIEVIFSEYVYGLNFVKDFFIAIRDFVGGRINSIEQPIHDTNQKIIKEMKEKAYKLGGDAVIGLKIDYSSSTRIISIVAVGTVVKLKKQSNNQ